MPPYIDPEDFPFTEAEVRRALRLVGMSAPQAKEAAAEIARLPGETAELAAAARAAIERGSTDPAEINPPTWFVGDEIFALLACVSDPLARRVDRFMDRRWERETRERIRGETYLLHGGWTEAEPPPEAVRRARRKVGHGKGRWTRLKRQIAKNVEAVTEPPPG